MTLGAVTSRLLLFLSGLEADRVAMFTVFANLLIVLLGTFFAVRHFSALNRQAGLGEAVKYGMKATTMFALLMSLFVLLYYNYIDRTYFQTLAESRISMAEEAGAGVEEMKNVRRTARMIFSPKIHAAVTMLGLTFCGAVYSFLVAYLTRKMKFF